MGTATYKLFKVVGGIAHYAQVTVSAEFAEETSVAVSPNAFAWLREGYGPSASTSGPGFELEAAEAVAGAMFALEHVAGPKPHAHARVVIESIRSTATDTAPGNFAYATCCAVWQALDLAGNELPPLLSEPRPEPQPPVKDVWQDWFP